MEIRRKDKNIINSDPNYPEIFWPKIITLTSIGAFTFWVMTSPDRDTTVQNTY